MSGPRLDRRGFLGVAAAASAVAVTGWAVPTLVGSQTSTGAALRSRRPLPAPFTTDLPMPPVLSPTKSRAGTDLYDLRQSVADLEILPGTSTEAWTYGGSFPGPTVETRAGREVVVHHRNELPVPTVTHLHGGHVPATSDGFPTDLVLPVGSAREDWDHGSMPDADAVVTAGTRVYRYPNRQRAAALWYHDHRMDYTAPAVYRGLAGSWIVRVEEDDATGLPSGDHELTLMIADRAFGEDAELLYPALDPDARTEPGVEEPWAAGVLGDVVLVDGAPWPRHAASAVRHRLRLLNGSNARRYDLVLDPPPPDGSPPFVRVGSDGGLLMRPLAADSVLLAPAERADVVVDLGRYPVGTRVVVRNRLDSGGPGVVMRFDVVRRAPDGSRIPARLSAVEILRRSDAVRERSFGFAAGRLHGRRGWLIGQQPYDPTRIDAAPRLGDTEIWRFVADVHHPVHLHLNPFQVLRRGRGGPAASDTGWKDTVDLRPGEAVEVVTRFEGYRGRYVFHCHNLEHEDMEMMANFRVV